MHLNKKIAIRIYFLLDLFLFIHVHVVTTDLCMKLLYIMILHYFNIALHKVTPIYYAFSFYMYCEPLVIWTLFGQDFFITNSKGFFNIYIFFCYFFFFEEIFFFFLNVHLCLLSEYLVMNRYLKLVLYGLVLVGSRNGFERDFIIKLKCQISPHVKYRQIQNPNQFNNSGHFSYCSNA